MLPTLLNSAFNSAFPRISRHPISQNVKQPPPPRPSRARPPSAGRKGVNPSPSP